MSDEIRPEIQNQEPNLPNLNTPEEPVFRQVWLFLFDIIKIVVLSLAIVLPVRFFLIQPFSVKGASMEPNFFDHEYLVIDEISYRLSEVKRGDVVVFRYPSDPRQYFIKRVVGLPGDTVQIKDGKISITNKEHPEGWLLDESEYLPSTHTQGSVDAALGLGEYYVLGDNRASSLDSRVFGPINDSAIIGRAWVRGWPFSRLHVFSTPSYQ